MRQTPKKPAKLFVDGNVIVVYAAASDDRSVAVEQAVKSPVIRALTRFSPTALIACLALVLVTAGTAGAAAMISGKQVMDGCPDRP